MHEDKGRLAGAAILKGQLDAAVHYRRHVTSPASLLQIDYRQIYAGAIPTTPIQIWPSSLPSPPVVGI